MSTLLLGIVGSTAYGLNNEDSDTDYLGVFAEPTLNLVGMTKPKESIESHEPDMMMHEAGKYARLCLGGNPSLTELLWLPDHLYVSKEPLGQDLIDIRQAFLSASRVRDAYLGYAEQQFRRYVSRGKFNSDISDKRAAKHARHLVRLVRQGYELHATGFLTVKLDNPEWYFDFAQRAVEDPSIAEALLSEYKEMFEGTKSALPEKPDVATVEDWLRSVRKANWYV